MGRKTIVAGLVGIPIAATAAFLRLKYGATVFADLGSVHQLVAHQKSLITFQEKNIKMVDWFEENAKETPEKVFLLYKDESYTYGDVDKEATKLAHFIQGTGVVTCKETAAIFMYNEPSFVLFWLAYNKLGLRIAFLNYNLRGDALLHCIKACGVKAIACSTDPVLLQALEDVMPQLEKLDIKVWVPKSINQQVIPDGMIHVNTCNERSDPIPRSVRDAQPNGDDALYIFTSGTTGLPKPVKITHTRQVRGSFVLSPLELSRDDVMYTTLPLYHSAAFVVGFLNVIRVGGTIVLSNFSARRFWNDIRKYRATTFQYIGEICRYLLAQPPRPDDGKYSHKIRYAIGNGLRPDIWEVFQTRFNIGHMAEFYGATEAPAFFINTDGKVGSTGRNHGIVRALTDIITIVQCDLDMTLPLRTPDGRCMLTPPGKAGLMLLRLSSPEQFTGYLSKKSDNEEKIIRNVKKTGDTFFNTGDLMIHDIDGYLYFVDRLGDTFRWKGENVATTEVAHMLNQYPGVQESNVYGVQVPGHDGKAGMAAIVFKKDYHLDPKSFYEHVVKSLPLYACPKFLRLMKEMDITGTFKHKKIELAREGFDPNVISDPLFFMDTEMKTYVPLDIYTLRRVVIGQARL